MRERLTKLDGQRLRFEATFARFGEKTFKHHVKVTALFVNVTNSLGVEVTDHLWFTVGKRMAALDLKPGDRVSFKATVGKYRKGYRGGRDDDDLPPPSVDYCLKRAADFVRVTPQSPSQADIFAPVEPVTGEQQSLFGE
jgi:hypothetical protein